MKTGTILLENANGVLCRVSYLYDPAQEDYVLFPSKCFPTAYVQYVRRVMLHLVKAIIKNDIQADLDLERIQKSIPAYAPCVDRPSCGLLD
jgi:hypothetical protein